MTQSTAVLTKINERIDRLFEDEKDATSKHLFFPDENELMNSRVVSTASSYFINDVIAVSKNDMQNYSIADFKTNGYIVGNDKPYKNIGFGEMEEFLLSKHIPRTRKG